MFIRHACLICLETIHHLWFACPLRITSIPFAMLLLPLLMRGHSTSPLLHCRSALQLLTFGNTPLACSLMTETLQPPPFQTAQYPLFHLFSHVAPSVPSDPRLGSCIGSCMMHVSPLFISSQPLNGLLAEAM